MKLLLHQSLLPPNSGNSFMSTASYTVRSEQCRYFSVLIGFFLEQTFAFTFSSIYSWNKQRCEGSIVLECTVAEEGPRQICVSPKSAWEGIIPSSPNIKTEFLPWHLPTPIPIHLLHTPKSLSTSLHIFSPPSLHTLSSETNAFSEAGHHVPPRR